MAANDEKKIETINAMEYGAKIDPVTGKEVLKNTVAQIGEAVKTTNEMKQAIDKVAVLRGETAIRDSATAEAFKAKFDLCIKELNEQNLKLKQDLMKTQENLNDVLKTPSFGRKSQG